MQEIKTGHNGPRVRKELNVNSKQNAVIPTLSISNNDDQQISDTPRQNKTISNITSNDLYEVHCTMREVITKFDGEN